MPQAPASVLNNLNAYSAAGKSVAALEALKCVILIFTSAARWADGANDLNLNAIVPVVAVMLAAGAAAYC